MPYDIGVHHSLVDSFFKFSLNCENENKRNLGEVGRLKKMLHVICCFVLLNTFLLQTNAAIYLIKIVQSFVQICLHASRRLVGDLDGGFEYAATRIRYAQPW